MRISDLEAWVIATYRILLGGGRVEDSRIELKATWPETAKAARRLAGHLNSARGESVLWVIGLDEEKGVVPFAAAESKVWLEQVFRQFDSISPSVLDVVIPTNEGPLVALLFSGERCPFVVKNPNFGQPGGGPISLEVPWRQSTAVRSASRMDLLSILVPASKLPHIEFLNAAVTAEESDGKTSMAGEYVPPGREVPHCWWTVDVQLYVTPRSSELLVLPVHLATVSVHANQAAIAADDIRFGTPSRMSGNSFQSDSHTISTTHGEALLEGPGRLEVVASVAVPDGESPDLEEVILTLGFRPAGEDTIPVVSQCRLKRGESRNGRKWILVPVSSREDR